MAEVGGPELLRQWQAAVQSLASSAANVAGRSEVPQQLVVSMQRQLELVEELFERERRLQEDLVARTLAPVDAVLDVLEQSAAALRRQAEALKDSARALEQASEMIGTQAELFERAIGIVRKPADIVTSGASAPRRPARRPRSRS